MVNVGKYSSCMEHIWGINGAKLSEWLKKKPLRFGWVSLGERLVVGRLGKCFIKWSYVVL